jgi:hypothetical protein
MIISRKPFFKIFETISTYTPFALKKREIRQGDFFRVAGNENNGKEN